MRALRRAGRWLLPPVTLYVLLLLDWRGPAPTAAPVVRRAFQVSTRLEAGAAAVRLSPPLPVVRAGYGFPRAVAEREREPLEVRALVVRAGDRALTIVLADLVLVPDELVRALEGRLADLGLDGVILVATHTHSSVGGFDARVLAQAVGTGRYRPDVVAAILDHAEEAVRQAQKRLVKVTVRTAETRLSGWAENRSSPGGIVDDALTVAQLEGDGGTPVATMGIMAAHPTLFPRTTAELSPDYPGVVMRRLESAGGVAFLIQGAEGDARPPRSAPWNPGSRPGAWRQGTGEEAIEAAGAFVAQRIADAVHGCAATEPRLGYANVEVALPPAEPQSIRPFWIRRPASNILEWMAPRAAQVSVVTLGDLTLLGVPGEPTALAAQEIVRGIPPGLLEGRKARVVALVNGYLGYVDTPERVRGGQGEARRAWFGPGLMEALGRGLQVALETQHAS